MIEYAIRPGAYNDHGLFYRTLPYFLIATSNMSPINVPIMNMTTRIITVMWKGSHHRIPFHFKYGWFTPSYTTNAIERFTPSYTTNDTKLWKASQR